MYMYAVEKKTIQTGSVFNIITVMKIMIFYYSLLLLLAWYKSTYTSNK